METYCSICTGFQIKPEIILQLQIDVGETDYGFTDETFSLHALAAVQPKTHSH